MARIRSCAVTLVLAGASVAPAGGQGWDEGPPRDHEITIDDYFTIGYVDACAFAPDGTRIVYVERRWEDGRDDRNADLWLVDLGSGSRSRLTFDAAADGDPRWGPEGRWIYFTSARGAEDTPPRNGKRQVWRIDAAGGPVTAVTREPEGVRSYELSRDGRSLYYVTRRDHAADDRWASLRDEHDTVRYGAGGAVRDALHVLDLESWRSTTLVDDGRVIRDFTASPDGRRIAMITAPDARLITYEGRSHVDVWTRDDDVVRRLADRGWRQEAPSPYGWILEPTWSDDGRALAFRVDFDGYPGEVFVAEFAEDASIAPKPWRLERPDEVHVKGKMSWRPGGRELCFLADWRARRRVYVVHDVAAGGQGVGFPLTPGDVVVHDFSFAADPAKVAVVVSGLDHPPDVFTLTEPGPDTLYERRTEVNPQVARWKVPQIEQFRWTSPDGAEVEGILELPHGWRRGTTLPLVVHLHGGPTASSKYAMQYGMGGRTIFAARGWALLSPNYRGSTGYGDRFLTDLIGRKNDVDVADIEAGIDALVARGIADPERIAVMGWSNGGYLTNCLIARSERFKAASSGAGVFDTVMQWSIEDTPGHVVNYQQGLPWGVADSMRRASALYQADRISTPTLIHVGEHDERVPAEHSRALHRALYDYLDVPTELIVYPEEGHGLTKRSHRKAKLEWDVRWMEYWVGEEGTKGQRDKGTE